MAAGERGAGILIVMAKKNFETKDSRNQTSVNNKKSSAFAWILGAVAALLMMAGIGIYAGYSMLIGPGVDSRAVGFSNQPIDQPSPIPSSGQVNMIGSYCSIVTPHIAEELGAVGDPIEVKGPIGACDIALNDGALIQISSVGPYGRLSQSDNPHFAQSVTIAGLEGRMYNLSAPLSGECTIKLNTRSITVPTINVRWNITNDLKRATKRAKSCEIAQRAADVFAKAYVPLAGGTAYQGTLQAPVAGSIEDYPCRIVTNAAALHADVYDIQDDRNGRQSERRDQRNQCTYAYRDRKAVVTLDTSGHSLEHFPVPAGAESTSRTLGPLSARIDQRDGDCSFVVELAPGIILDIAYSGAKDDGLNCRMAEHMQANAIKTLIDISSINQRT